MAGFSRTSAILIGARRRVALTLIPMALLWLGVLWAGFAGRSPAMPASAPPGAPVLQAVAAVGDAAPVEGSFDGFDVETRIVPAPANRRGDVAFFARLLRGKAEEGIFLASGGRIVKLAAIGDAIPEGETIAGFGEQPAAAINAAGAVAFTAQLTGGRATSGVLLAQNGKLTTIAASGTAAAGGTLVEFQPPAINDAGDVAFLAALKRGREAGEAILVAHAGQLTKRAASGDPAPGGGIFASFGNPALNNKGELAFGAVLEQGPIIGGVFAGGARDLRLVLAAGSAAPTGGIFARFSERLELNDAGTLALSAVLRQGGPAAAMFLIEKDTPRSVAALGESAPGGGSYAAFASWPALSAAGDVAFIASIDGGPNGLGVFLVGADGAKRLATIGDVTPLGRIAGFPLYPALAMAPNGAVSFVAGIEREGGRSDALLYYGPPRGSR
jgi:hypothetical protein